jgi:glycosyltransferase involved in cell wall biosynthesis
MNQARSSTSSRLAFISQMVTMPWGGSEPLWRDAALRLRSQGFDVTACVKGWGRDESPQITQLEKDGCHVIRRVPAPPLRWWKRGLLKLPGDPCRIRRPDEIEELARTRPTFALLSHGACWIDDSFWKPLAAANVPYALLIQAANEQWWPSDAEREWRAAPYKAAHSVFFVSEANRQLLADQLQFDHPRAKVVRNPFNLKARAIREWPDTANGWRLAFVGRLEPWAKGCDLLLKVLAQDKWKNRPLHCSFIGSGLAAESVKAMSSKLGLANVSFPGHSSDIAAVWERHHALVLPSRYEGLPLAIVEAMSCGRTCIVTDVSGNGELIEDGVTGFLAEGASVTSLDRALERAWERRNDWRQMGASAFDAVMASVPNDPVGAFCEELLSIIRSLKTP